MSIAKFAPVAAAIGILAGGWIAVGNAYSLVLWVPFLSWALVFGAGAAKFSRVPKEVIGLVGGTAIAVILVLLIPRVTDIVGGTLALPLLVFLAAFIIVMLELTDLFELAPAYFYSFAGFFAYLFGGFEGGVGITTGSVTMYIVLLLVGTGLGLVSVIVRNFILNALKVPKDQQQTVFDKERKMLTPRM